MKRAFGTITTFFLMAGLLGVLPDVDAQLQESKAAAVKIGVILPLTGGYAEWALHVRQGMEMAQHKAKHVFEFIYEDEGPCDAPARSLSAMKKLASIDKVHIIISGCLSGTKVLGPVAKQQGLLLLSPGLLDREVLSHQYPLINLATEISGEARYLSTLLADSGAKKVASIRVSDAFAEEFSQTVTENLEKLGVALVLNEQVSSSMQDFRSLLARIKSSGADSLLINSLGKEQQISLMRQLSQLKLSIQVFGNYMIEGNAASEEERKWFEGVRYTYPVNSSAESTEKVSFDKRYAEEYPSSKQPIANTYFTYDGLLLLDVALNFCEQSDKACLKAKLANGEKHRGISGDMTINSDGSNNRPYGFKVVKNGRFEWLKYEIELNGK